MAPIDKRPEICSAVSTMDRSIPDFDYSHLVRELRTLILSDIKIDGSKFSEEDIDKVYNDEWFVARYLLRVKLDVKSAHQMMRRSLEFRNLPRISIKEFPIEFYKIGAMFDYEPDRRGNIPVYLRVKLNQKIPIMQDFLKAFIFRVIEKADQRANGKGIVLIFDLQGAGIPNADMDLLFFITTSLANYFPKGLSYMLVHELPWVLRSVWTIARKWLSEEHKDLVKFSDSHTIYHYFKEENLPDFMGGICKKDYRAAPDNCITLAQVAKRWNLNEDELHKTREKYAKYLPQE